MKACASLGGHTGTGALPANEPLVFVDGALEPRLRVASLTVEGPLNERRLVLASAAAVEDGTLAALWAHRDVLVAMPYRLVDDQQRWSVLARGEMQRAMRHRAAGLEQQQWELHDQWTRALAQPVDHVWWATHEGALTSLDCGTLLPGPGGNRSPQTFDIHGRKVHVPQVRGERWTVGSALATISALGELRLSLHLLPRLLREATLLHAVDLAQPVGDVLRQVVEPYGLIVQRTIRREGRTVTEDRHVRALQHGRPVRLRWAEIARPLADALRIDLAAPLDAAQRWIVEASGWQIESTFELVGGWNPALEGEADAAYDRTQSNDFARYANVYRHWVLNEDGRFSAAPYNRGAPFNLAAFFGDSGVRAQPLPFRSCVTLDDTGEPRLPVVEISTDSGQSWSQYPGRAVVQRDRAAVYLDDDALPGTFLTALQSGSARLRVTASLRSPQPVRRVRWRGNPFAGRRTARVLKVGEAFQFRRIDVGSMHHGDVQSGALATRAIDQRQALDAWLVERLREAEQRAEAALEGRGRIELAGAWPWLRIGDRLIEASAPRRDATGGAEAVTRRGAVVTSLHVRFPVTEQSGPRTTVHVHF
ncbi:MAG: hypothetical protein ACODAQ_04345 [Phycisphaeraceae bacterium]